MAALSVLLTLTLAPAKVGSVWLNALTNDEVWSAIVSDIDIGATIAAPARAVAQRAPLEQLKRLEGVLGEARTEALIAEVKGVQEEVALALEASSDSALEQLVSRSIPNFLMGEDLTGQDLHRDLSLDLSGVRDELDASFQKLGHLLVDAGADAASNAVREQMSPEALAQLDTVELDAVHAQLDQLERQLTTLSRALDVLVVGLPMLEFTGVTDGGEDAERLTDVTEQLRGLADLGLAAVDVGRTQLDAYSTDGTHVEWETMLLELSDTMVAEIERNAEARADNFAEAFAYSLLGEGVFQAPLPVRLLIVEQLRPIQIAIAGTVHLAKATQVFVVEAVGCLGLALLILTARLRRALWWFGWVGLFSAWAVGLAAKTALTAAQSLANGFGGIGTLLKEAGAALGLLLNWCWNLIARALDMEPVNFEGLLDGWTAADVTNSETYAAFLREFVAPLQSWSGDMSRASVLAIVLGVCLSIVERVARRMPDNPRHSPMGRLQQFGGLRIDDPLWVAYPSRGQAALLRPLLLDAVGLAMVWLGFFAGLGGLFMVLVGPTGLEVALTPALALGTSLTLACAYGGLRLGFGGASSIHGRLHGEQQVLDENHDQGSRTRTVLSLAPSAIAISTIGLFVATTADVALAVIAPLLFWLSLEGASLALTGGRQTLSSWLGGKQLTAGEDTIAGDDRQRLLSRLTKAGTVWSLLWGAVTVALGGLGLYSLMTGIVTLLFWYQHASGQADTLRDRPTAYLRLGALFSLDLVSIAIGLVTLRQLQTDNVHPPQGKPVTA